MDTRIGSQFAKDDRCGVLACGLRARPSSFLFLLESRKGVASVSLESRPVGEVVRRNGQGVAAGKNVTSALI